MVFTLSLFKETSESLYIVVCVHAKPLTVDEFNPAYSGLGRKSTEDTAVICEIFTVSIVVTATLKS